MSNAFSLLRTLREDPGGYNRAQREVAPHLDDLIHAVNDGYSLRRCYEALKSANEITIAYSSFRRAWLKLRDARAPEPASGADPVTLAPHRSAPATPRDKPSPSRLRAATWTPRRTHQET